MKTLLIVIAIVWAAAVGGLSAACGASGGAPETARIQPPDADAAPSGTPQPLRAPEFELPSAQGGDVSLSGLLNERNGAVLVFYRGFF